MHENSPYVNDVGTAVVSSTSSGQELEATFDTQVILFRAPSCVPAVEPCLPLLQARDGPMRRQLETTLNENESISHVLQRRRRRCPCILAAASSHVSARHVSFQMCQAIPSASLLGSYLMCITRRRPYPRHPPYPPPHRCCQLPRRPYLAHS